MNIKDYSIVSRFGKRIILHNGKISGFIDDSSTIDDYFKLKKSNEAANAKKLGRKRKNEPYKHKTNFRYNIEDKSLIGTTILI